MLPMSSINYLSLIVATFAHGCDLLIRNMYNLNKFHMKAVADRCFAHCVPQTLITHCLQIQLILILLYVLKRSLNLLYFQKHDLENECVNDFLNCKQILVYFSFYMYLKKNLIVRIIFCIVWQKDILSVSRLVNSKWK